jgi:NADH dehydrogenase FAD-containing subunit
MVPTQNLDRARHEYHAAQTLARARFAAINRGAFDMVVVGGGMTGASTLYHLATQTGGVTALLVERGEIGVGAHDRMMSAAATSAPRDHADEARWHSGHGGGVC